MSTPARSRLWLLPGVLAALALGGAVRADNPDPALLKETPRLLAELTKYQGQYKTIGILPFKVQKGTRPTSFHAAPLAAGFPERLAVAIVLTMEVKKDSNALNVIDNAPGVVAAAK